MFTKILVPLDGSELTEGILPYVSLLARGLNTPVLLASVIERHGSHGESTEHSQIFAEAETQARNHLKRLIERLSRKGVQVEAWVSHGNPEEEIVSIAEHHGCDLIAMSTHGRSDLARSILGSVADKVIHSSHLPVLTITSEKAEMYRDEEVTLFKIMVPLDGSTLAETVLPFVEELARRLSIEILLVRVVKPLQLFWMDRHPDGLIEQEEAEASDYLEAVAHKLRGSGLRARWQVLVGHPAGSIVDLAQHTAYDMIALTSHGRMGITRWALGSVAEALVRGSGDPVLIVPRCTKT